MKRFAPLGLILAMLVVAGCADNNVTKPDNNKQSKAPVSVSNNTSQSGSNVQNELQKIMNQKTSPQELIAFANHNISKLSKADATRLVLHLESVQRSQIDSRTDAWLNPDIQAALLQVDYNGTLDDMIKGTNHAKLKAMLTKTRDNGFKLIILEGAFYPIIDYEKYKIYQPYVNDDIEYYIDIAASESEQICTEDNGLVISWPELAMRTLRAESYIKKYPNSPRIADVREQYETYVTNYLYGANNSPAFDYDSKELDKSARKSYYELAKSADKSQVAELIKEYLPILEKNNYKRTPEVEQSLKNAENKLLTTH